MTVWYAIEVGAPFFLGTNPTLILTRSGRPLRWPARESGTCSEAVFWACLRWRYLVARLEPEPLIRPGE